ncbi:hypothetical protein MTO96_013338 [Rhipicephalus appendiculatus]
MGTSCTLSPKQRHSVPWAQQWQPSVAAVSVKGTGNWVPAAGHGLASAETKSADSCRRISSASSVVARRPVIASLDVALSPGAEPRTYSSADRSAALQAPFLPPATLATSVSPPGPLRGPLSR